MLHTGEDGALASALKRALAPDERPKRLREGWASRKRCANGAERTDALERPSHESLVTSFILVLIALRSTREGMKARPRL
jgi:hypothetical protein